MEKKILIFVSVIIASILTSCNDDETTARILSTMSDDFKAKHSMYQMLKAIQQKDRQTIKKLFSEQAINYDEDIEHGINYLFDVYEGNLISLEQRGEHISEYNHYGQVKKESNSIFIIETSKHRYLVFYVLKIKNTENPSSVGVYTLRIKKIIDDNLHFGHKREEMTKPGIFVPDSYSDDGSSYR